VTSIQWLGDIEAKPAPGPLRRIQAFINTIDLESGQDRLARIDDARPWLVDNQLLAADAVPDPDDLRLVSDFREGLRALVIQNSGGATPDPVLTAPLHAVAESSAVRAVLDESGRIELVTDDDSLRGRLLSLLLTIRTAQLDGTWVHMKACANDDCLWAFYDHSRNHGGTWCDMATCGNKLKNREFRARRRQPR
jgi:predicted RNA-binding Zn ribbon-like protein